MRRKSGASARSKKSNDGAVGLWVPPSSSSVHAPGVVISAGSSACTTSSVLPAEPIANR